MSRRVHHRSLHRLTVQAQDFGFRAFWALGSFAVQDPEISLDGRASGIGGNAGFRVPAVQCARDGK